MSTAARKSKATAKAGTSATRSMASRAATGVAATAARQRRIQRAHDRHDASAGSKDDESSSTKKPGVQAGSRRQPDRMPAQHQSKPGSEAALRLAPQLMAPDYPGSGKLDGFAAIVTGGDLGIGRAVAVLFAREGADGTVAT